MIEASIAEQISDLRIKTRKILNGSMLGEQRAINKGAGFDFDQVREYVQGDDLRFIDWKSTARTGKLLTKQYFEERNYNIMIALDLSGSSFIGSKYHVMANLAAIFTLVAEYGKDNVGLVLFSNQIELELPVRRGQAHVFRVMSEIFGYKKGAKFDFNKQIGTNLDHVFRSLAKSLKTKTLIVLISDMIDNGDYQKSLKQLQCRHEVVAVRCLDIYEQSLPQLGLLPIIDPETGELGVIDARINGELHKLLAERVANQNILLRACGVDVLQVNDEAQAIVEVVKFFRKRLMY